VAAPPIDFWEAEDLQHKLRRDHGLDHIRVRKHGKLLILESGPEADPWPHARVRRDTVHLWWLEMPARTPGRWDKTPYRATLDELVELLTTQFAWMVAPVPAEPGQD